MHCIQCKAQWADHENMVASISLEVQGDEHSYTYWLCPACDVYTRMWFVDHFLGSDDAMTPVLLDRERGDAIVALIEKCPDPSWKRCKCDSHRALAR